MFKDSSTCTIESLVVVGMIKSLLETRQGTQEPHREAGPPHRPSQVFQGRALWARGSVGLPQGRSNRGKGGSVWLTLVQGGKTWGRGRKFVEEKRGLSFKGRMGRGVGRGTRRGCERHLQWPEGEKERTGGFGGREVGCSWGTVPHSIWLGRSHLLPHTAVSRNRGPGQK